MKYFRLGRVSGIDIHVNWSWLLILGLVSWSLSLTFGQVHNEWPVNLRWGMALLAAILFFFSVLAHELAHSLVALARGVPVANITLFLFGGVSNMQREPSSPAEEMVITIVGPLMSLFLGAACLVIGAGEVAIDTGSLLSPAILTQLQPVNTTLAWLGSVNIMIGLFNLIPAFPLDGGRMVRSLIWAALKDMRRSTRWATWLGQAIAWAMIAAGAAMVLGVKVSHTGRRHVQRPVADFYRHIPASCRRNRPPSGGTGGQAGNSFGSKRDANQGACDCIGCFAGRSSQEEPCATRRTHNVCDGRSRGGRHGCHAGLTKITH